MLQSEKRYVSSASVSGVDPLSYAQRTLPGALGRQSAQFGEICSPHIQNSKR